MTDFIKAASAIATIAHHGQMRRDGSPYIVHPLEVAIRVTPRLQPIAWLHDAPEDSMYSMEMWDQIFALFPDYVGAAIRALTLTSYDDYFETYLPRVKANPDALAVKLADIAHNLSDQPTEKQKAKYARAIAYLTGTP